MGFLGTLPIMHRRPTARPLRWVLIACALVIGTVALPLVPSGAAPAGRAVDRSEGCRSRPAHPPGRVALTTGGPFARPYLLDTPAMTRRRRPPPLLLVLHPFVLPETAMALYTELPTDAVARGYLVATPRGSTDPIPRWVYPGGLLGSDTDLLAIDELIAELDATACFDRRRVFASGFSAGGAMAAALSCHRADTFAAVGVVAGVNLTPTCPEQHAMPILAVHGTADFWVPFLGSRLPFMPIPDFSVTDAMAAWADRNGCDPSPAPTTPVAVGVVRQGRTGCDATADLLVIEGGGHTWPGASIDLPFVGTTSRTIDANTRLLDFFGRQGPR